MDTRLKEEFLTCIVCQEVFRDPVTLHCGHTVCMQCVTAFTKTQEDAIEKQSIPCPHCRGYTKVPDPKRPVEEWAGQIKTGFFVKGLVETFLAKDTAERDKCYYCQDEGDTRQASVWCSNCEKSLCAQCEKSHHKFLPSHKVSNISSKGHNVPETNNCACPEHPDTVVDMFCQTCDVAACPRCCLKYHMTCVENIVSLADEMERITSVLQKETEILTMDIEDLQKHIPRRRTQIKDLESNDDKVEASIEDFGNRISSLVKRHLRDKYLIAKQEALESLKEDVRFTEKQLQVASQTYCFLENVLKSSSDINRYDMYKVTSAKEDTSIKADILVTDIGIFDNIDTISKNIDTLQLGDISVMYDQRASIGRSTNITLLEEIDTRIGDKDPSTFDVMVVHVGGIKTVIVADCTNKKVKAFYSKGGKDCHSELTTNDSPCQLTSLPGNRGAVAVCQSSEIVIFNITPDLVVFRTVSTCHAYTGLTLTSDSSFAATWRERSVTGIDFIDITGQVISSKASDELSRPVFITAKDESSLLVSDFGKGTVKAVCDKGVFTTYASLNKEITCPRGIVKTKSGECFVVDRTSNRVLYFSENGDDWRIVLTDKDGLDYPNGLFVDERNLMYVCVKNRYVNVYRFTS